MPWRRRRYDPYDPYDPYPPPRRWGRSRPYYQPTPGGSCLRDSCLLETGCCIGEGLDGNCLVLALLAVPGLVAAFGRPSRYPVAAEPAPGRVAQRLVAAIRVYQRDISARRAPACRFEPTCSEYGAQALRRHGAARGSVLLARRLLRCRPGGRRGADPVPEF
ncbi:MAG TPA: membrane protein insertion efficiency factor YidD [Pseudonocardia sp.]